MSRLLKAIFILSTAGFLTSSPSFAAVEKSITHKGTTYQVVNTEWYRAKTKETYRTVECGGGVGMKIIKTPTKKYLGKMIACGNKRTEGKLEYKGKMFNTWDGRTYSGKLIMKEGDPNTLVLHGCVLGGLICADENLTRVK